MTNIEVRSLPKIPRNNNFDFLRFLLAFSVFIGHFGLGDVTVGLVGAPLGFIASYAVRCFFVISGFLIFMSYENSKSLRDYYLKRIRRIYPAYCFIILATALGLFLLSKFSWQNYFFNSELFKYIFFNLIFISNVQQTLPGVFTENSSALVDGPFWTIKIEVLFYVSVPILVFLFRKFNKFTLICLIYVFSYLYFVSMMTLYQKTGATSFENLSRQLPGAMSFFLSGTLLYYYFDLFKKYALICFSISVAILIVQSNLLEANLLHPAVFTINLLLPISLGIIIIFIAFSTPHTQLFSKYGDLSYGIYLFHFPIIQIFTSLKLYAKYPDFAPALTVAVVLGCAFLSWHIIEKPFLSRKSHYLAD